MTKKFDRVVFIGRFQAPVHNAHAEILRRAAELADHVIVIIGSANEPRTVMNPFTAKEREHIIRTVWANMENRPEALLSIISIENNRYNNQAWAISVQEAITEVAGDFTKRTAIIGHKKDESSFYLDWFPQWTFVPQRLIEPLNATQIRDHYFSRNSNLNFLKGVVPTETITFLEAFKKTTAYMGILEEKEFIDEYKKSYANLPYPPVFVTTDAVVVQSGHVLMVRRRARPGKGLLAFPGGFLNTATDKSLVDGMIRELKEETKIKVPEKVLRGSICATKTFDAIDRSSRGRTITHAFHLILTGPNGGTANPWELPKVTGSDDAEKAFWIPIGNVNRAECFEDHWDILKYFVGF